MTDMNVDAILARIDNPDVPAHAEMGYLLPELEWKGNSSPILRSIATATGSRASINFAASNTYGFAHILATAKPEKSRCRRRLRGLRTYSLA
jgi:hypothetical protein